LWGAQFKSFVSFGLHLGRPFVQEIAYLPAGRKTAVGRMEGGAGRCSRSIGVDRLLFLAAEFCGKQLAQRPPGLQVKSIKNALFAGSLYLWISKHSAPRASQVMFTDVLPFGFVLALLGEELGHLSRTAQSSHGLVLNKPVLIGDSPGAGCHPEPS
jgi:hypothetical protein